MKKSILTMIALAVCLMAASGQETEKPKEIRTLLGGNITHGGYGGIMINYSVIDDKDAILVGGKGAWIINHSLGIGIGGYGFANNVPLDNYPDNQSYFLGGGYGGLLIEPVIFPMSPVHVAIPVLIGAGGVALVRDYVWTYGDPHNYYTEDADAFFVIEPGIELEFNMVRFMRLALNVSYRYTQDVALGNLDTDFMNGMSGGITFKFGKF